jgi:murein L,D-transpeptidase YcbB/YkuD
MLRHLIILEILITLFMHSCNSNVTGIDQNYRMAIDTLDPGTVAGKFSTQEQLFIDTTVFENFFKKYSEFKGYEESVNKFYALRKNKLAWFSEKGIVEQSSILYNRIQSMTDNGLKKEVHYPNEYSKAVEAESRDSISWYELMITAQYLHFAEKVITGLPNKIIAESEWYIPRKKVGYATMLENMLTDSSATLNKFVYYQYQLLREQLKRLKVMENKGGWPIPENINKSLILGDTGKQVKILKLRLYQEEYAINDTAESLFDKNLEDAVKLYQKNNGLHADGIVGKGTIKMMQVTIKERIEQVMVNMERCRWLPANTSKKYLYVNIPEYKLHIIENDVEQFSMSVIVGKRTNKTAIFKSNITHVVFSPYWNIPTSILMKEIVPQINRNPEYLSKNHMEWNNGHLRQKPGPDNALGGIKFIFPNPFNIYLHDTPTKYLFEKEKRNFSHGCIRIGNPIKLASYLLADNYYWTDEKINEAMNRTTELVIPIAEKVPVYVVYFTAFVDADQRLNYREDIYNRDKQIINMLLK